MENRLEDDANSATKYLTIKALTAQYKLFSNLTYTSSSALSCTNRYHILFPAVHQPGPLISAYSEQIADFLNIIGAHQALLELENIRIQKGMRNQVNRLVNCESANMNKTIDAAYRQRMNIELIQQRYNL